MYLLGFKVTFAMRKIRLFWLIDLVDIFFAEEDLEVDKVQAYVFFDYTVHMSNILRLYDFLIQLLVELGYFDNRIFLLLGLASIVIFQLEILR